MLAKLRRTLVILSSSLAVTLAPSFAETIKVGAIVPLTGAFTRYGQKIQSALNSSNNGDLVFVFEDENCDPKAAISAYKKLSEIDGIDLFIGPWCGSPQTAVAPQLRAKNQIAILGASAPEGVFEASNGKMLSTQYSIEQESRFLGEKMNEKSVSSTLIVFKENAFSRAHEAAFRNVFKGKIIQTIAYSTDDPTELKNIAIKVKQLNPASLYVPDAFPLMAGLVKELRALNINKPIYSVYSAQSDDVLQAVQPYSYSIIYSYPDIGDKEAFTYFPTLAVQLLLRAAKSCGKDVTCIRENLLHENKFNSKGTLSGGLILKTIKDGKFSVVD